ncbi:MAG TPA: cytochrome P450 [Acidimicrobiales bacterium]|nr:cytochrome P450 [Acidimicrobiales bacterium]
MSATDTAELYWDPFDTEIDVDPHPVWRRLRDDAPVYRNDQYDFYALSRYHDVEAAHRDPGTFSSAKGTVLEMMGNDLSSTGQMIFLDPPQHTELRHLVSRAFTPRRIADLEIRIRGFCADMLDAQRGAPGFDYLQDFGAKLPSMVISSLLGVPPSDQETFRHVIERMFHIEPGVGMVNEQSLVAGQEIQHYLAGQLDERKATPKDDLLTGLAQAGLSRSASTDFATLLLAAGTETVARLLGWAAVVLAGHPAQRAELAADSTLLPNAIEELLRYEAPSPVQGRTTTREVELHDTVIPTDAKVLLLTGAAGRDERAYPDADRFDVHRNLHNHVSFGYGIHYCVGAALARLEGRIALHETLARYPEWEVDHARAVRLHTSTVRGYSSVPIFV